METANAGRPEDFIAQGTLVAVSHSGGKDSQAMMLELSERVPVDQLVVIHAPLGEVEWPGTTEHIRDTIPKGVPFIFAPLASGKTLLQRVEERGMWPDPARRWCTSDFKRGPIEREIRRYLKAHPRFRGRVISATGMRADESPRRTRLKPWALSPRNSKAGRVWFDWLPIHGWSAAQVFEKIRESGQKPHWAYAQGMSRLSCSFCIMGSRSDLRIAAKLRPRLFQQYADLEARIGHTFSPSRRPLPVLTGHVEGPQPSLFSTN